MVRWYMSDERICEEEVMAYARASRKSQKNLSQDKRCPGRYSNRACLEYEPKALQLCQSLQACIFSWFFNDTFQYRNYSRSNGRRTLELNRICVRIESKPRKKSGDRRCLGGDSIPEHPEYKSRELLVDQHVLLSEAEETYKLSAPLSEVAATGPTQSH
jgi:hypothetical protein